MVVALPCLAGASSVTVTIEDAGVMSANTAAFGAQGTSVETFDSAKTGHFSNYSSALGTYSAGRVDATNQYGGANGTQYLFSNSNPGTTLTLDESASYFGFWWSAGSKGNRVDLISDDTNIFSFDTDDVLAFLTDNAANSADYYGNPSPPFQGRVGNEPFVFINMFSDIAFDTVVFSGPNFESDNHTIAKKFTQQTGLNISAVPLPPTLLLLISTIGAFVATGRRQRNRAGQV
ncbi:MAG: hypothetical protein AAGF79_02015 [Pseudomonadota bacterium]